MCLNTISSKLKYTPLLIQLPVYDPQLKSFDTSSGMSGVIDLVEMKKLIFDPKSKGARIIEGLPIYAIS